MGTDFGRRYSTCVSYKCQGINLYSIVARKLYKKRAKRQPKGWLYCTANQQAGPPQKKRGAGYSTRAPHYNLLTNNWSQLPQSREVSLVMVQLTLPAHATT